MKEGQREKLKPCAGLLVFKDGKVLLGKRKGSHGAGEYSFPGGHLEYEESFEECLQREVEEEAQVSVKNIKFLCLANYSKHIDRQDILVGMSSDWESGEPGEDIMGKIGKWGWYSLDNLPTPLFYPTAIIIDSYKTGKNFYDKE